MATLSKEMTGLNNAIYISPKCPKHRPRIKVFKESPGSESVSVLIEPPHGISAGRKGLISERNLFLVRKWIDLNYDVLMDYWNGVIVYTNELLSKLKSI